MGLCEICADGSCVSFSTAERSAPSAAASMPASSPASSLLLISSSSTPPRSRSAGAGTPILAEFLKSQYPAPSVHKIRVGHNFSDFLTDALRDPQSVPAQRGAYSRSRSSPHATLDHARARAHTHTRLHTRARARARANARAHTGWPTQLVHLNPLLTPPPAPRIVSTAQGGMMER